MAIQSGDFASRLRSALVATAAAVSAATGCGTSVENGESQVWGRVTVRGVPVTSGTVFLKPIGDVEKTWGAGELDAAGRFRVRASRFDVPLMPGPYVVYLRPPPGDYDPDPPPGYPVAAKYLDSAAPVIRVEIPDEPIVLDLKLDD